MAYHMSRFKTSVLVGVLFCSSFLTSCGFGHVNQTPPPTISNPVYRPLIALDVEIDTPPLYNLGHEVALAVANKIDDMATRINSGGMVIFVCRVSSRSFEDCPVSFATPPIAAFVLPPVAPVCGVDPYQCSTQKQAYKKAFASWQVVHTRQVNNLAQVSAWVHHQTDKIRSSLTFPYDDKGSDIFGALATASQNFQGLDVKTPKFLVLATDFVSTTTRQDVGSFSLAGVRVSAIFRTCSDNEFCQESNSYWSSVVRRAGALSFQVYSPAASTALGLSF